MTYSEAIHFLYQLRWFGAKLGLSHTQRLAALSGNPENRLRFIHVAGTNGKGSTCAMLEAIYRAAGLKVGLFTSPHLVSFRERIQINRELISEVDVVRQVSELRPLLADFPEDDHPTFFEVVTIMALRYFAEQNCQLVIWETGLGGRLDATNIVTPLVSVITNIQYDHEQWLGHTLAAIAGEKAGIIKSGVPVVTATDEPEALAVIKDAARRQNAPLTLVGPSHADQPPLEHLKLPLLGNHQRLNAALAVAIVRILSNKLPVTEHDLIKGLSQLSWPGRLQLITSPSGSRVLLDGAHNLAGAQMLASAFKEEFASTRATLILGILADKDWQSICHALAPLAERILLVPVPSERTASPGDLADACRQANPTARISEHSHLRNAWDAAAQEDFVIISGSLYLIGEALEMFQSSPSAATERTLNEWGASGPRKAASV